MKDPLQQSYRNIALGNKVFIESSILLHFSLAEIATPAFAGAGLPRSSQ